jgi:hypothetical protein
MVDGRVFSRTDMNKLVQINIKKINKYDYFEVGVLNSQYGVDFRLSDDQQNLFYTNHGIHVVFLGDNKLFDQSTSKELEYKEIDSILQITYKETGDIYYTTNMLFPDLKRT